MSQLNQLLIITLCAAVTFLLVGLPAYLVLGWAALPAMVIAVVSCWAGVVLAILSINIFRSTLKKEFPWFIIGGIFRMGVPFAVVLVIAITTEKDFAFPVLILFPVVYLLMLPVDVLVMLPGKDKMGEAVYELTPEEKAILDEAEKDKVLISNEDFQRETQEWFLAGYQGRSKS
jgi:hypothetical protein